MDATTKCTGACCRKFNIPMTVEEIRESSDPDAAFVADMLIPLGSCEADTSMLVFHHLAGFDLPAEPGERTRRTHHFYTCKHLDDATGRCTVYDRRPRMCSMFPEQGACPYKGCDNGHGAPGVETRSQAAERLGRTDPVLEDEKALDALFDSLAEQKLKAEAEP